MKRIIVVCMAFIMIMGLSGCSYGDKYEDVKYDSVNTLKTQLGDQFLYPDRLPAGYKPMYTEITGLHYTRTDTWDYDILFHDYIYGSGDVNEELNSRIAENLPVVIYVHVRAFEPVHNPGNQGLRTKSAELKAYNDLVEESSDNIWNMGGVIVAHKTIDTAEGNIAGAISGRTVFDVSEELQETFDAYKGYLAYAVFFLEETLYTVEIQMDASQNDSSESMIELCGGMLETVVTGLLNSRQEL